MSQSCVSLADSTLCPGFNTSSVSTSLSNLFPFLATVTNTSNFDSGLSAYIADAYCNEKYDILFGCSNVNLSNTTSLYARYTASFLCNAIIQNSIVPCGLSAADSRPLCADACAEFALSEQSIVSSPELCGKSNDNTMKQLRADFTDCALPANSISGICVAGASNEPDNCGFSSNLEGLCSYCKSLTVNSTDSCCVTSNVQKRCQNVHLPVFSSMQPLFTTTSLPHSTSTSQPSSSAAAAAGKSSSHGLSGGTIAGIVIGAVIGAALLLLALIFCCLAARRRQHGGEKTALNQPSPARSGAAVQQPREPRFEALPGARVTRMAALEGSSSTSPATFDRALPPYRQSSSDFENSPDSTEAAAALEQRKKSGASESAPEESSPYTTSGGEYSTPEGVVGRQSEQMPFFKDYYSDDDIHPNDLVSTLWAYQPQAPDEFELDRGDMLRTVGIWDDGWATGVRVDDRAEDWDPSRRHRDSGVSNGSKQEDSPPPNGDLKAFPLVCVCLPQHWRKTLEGDQVRPDTPSD